MLDNFDYHPATPFGVDKIQEYIPHRSPFLLIDEVIQYELGKFIIARRHVPTQDPIFMGHFPQNPVLPGVLIVESMAQTSAVLGRLTEPQATNCLLTEISETRFRKQVLPGDILEFNIKVVNHRRHFFWFEGEAFVNNESVATTKFSARLF